MAENPSSTVVLPRKVRGVRVSQGSASSGKKGDQLRRDNIANINQQVLDFRNSSDSSQLLRALYETDGLVSTAISSMVRIASSGMQHAAYYTGTNEFSREGMQVVERVISSFDTLWDYTQGYSDKRSLDANVESMLLEVALSGGVGGELVLNKQRLPDRLIPIDYSSIIWKSDGQGGRKPWQKRKNVKPGQGTEVSLDVPTIWIAESAKPLDRVYGVSYMVASLKRLVHYDEFIEDMRRVIRQNGAPRLLVKLNEERVLRSAPTGVKNDPKKLRKYMQDVQEAVETRVKNLSPEDSLVYFDSVDIDSVDTAGEKKDYKDLLDALSGLTASAMKSNPSILGLRLGGSQNTSSTESMLFTHMAQMLQGPVEEVISRALTLAVRLHGVDVYVKSHFNPIDLRPEMELEGHKAIKQRRAMELLSAGRITDDEAQVMMGLGTLPEGAPSLSGTFFLDMKSSDSQIPDLRADPNGRQVAPDTPASEGGSDNQRRS
jgi:hypothetical protein